MKKIVKILVVIVLSAIAMGTIAGCDSLTNSSHTHTYGDWTVVTKATCDAEGLEERVCSCGEKETRKIDATGHTYSDTFTCHDRKCTVCDHVEKATTSHTLADEFTCHDRTCSKCGEVVTATTEHTLESSEICYDRTCSVCSTVVAGNHSFDSDGVCANCGKNVKELFVVGVTDAGVTPTVTCNADAGSYDISTTTSGVYFKIPGNILTALQTLGYTSLTVNVVNTAEGGATADNFRVLYIAKDSTANLWTAETAIAMVDRSPFWNNSKTVTLNLDLATYAGTDIYFFSDCGLVPLRVEVNEFFNYENKANWITGEGATTVNYHDGKGWVISAGDSNAYYANFTSKVVQYYIGQGCNTIRFTFKNDLGVEGVSNAGNYVNNDTRIMPKDATGVDDWVYYSKTVISQFATYDSATDTYYCYVDLSDTTHNFTKNIRFYFAPTDGTNNGVCNGTNETPNAFIANIEFCNFSAWAVVDNATCVDNGSEKRTCSICGREETRVIPATGHNFGDDNHTCHDRTCTVCQTVVQATTQHTYGDTYTCHDRTCTVCGDISYATTAHTYDANGICTACSTNIKSLLLASFAEGCAFSTITCNPSKGYYEITNTESNAYAKIQGSILTSLKGLGYTTLSFTVVNPAVGEATATNWRFFMAAADSTGNLWDASTAINYSDRATFWDNNKTTTFTLDLNTYAGRDIYLYTSCANTVPLQITVSEFVDWESKANWINGEGSTTVNYYDGKGWVVSNTAGGYYANIPGALIDYQMAKGNNSIRVIFKNDLGISGVTNAGVFSNTDTRIMPWLASGTDVNWAYHGSVIINEYATYDSQAETYSAVVVMTDNVTYNFSKGFRLYFGGADGANAVLNGLIYDIEFFKYVPAAPAVSTYLVGDSTSSVAYTEENGYVITATGSGAFYATIPSSVLTYYINNGYTKMTIAYANNLEGHAENCAYAGTRILPKLASNNEEDWNYASGAIVQYCTLNNSTGFYEDVIYLNNVKYNYAQDLRICFGNYDYSTSPETAINWARIASITFEKDEAPALSTYLVSDTNSTVNYVEGTGYTISATDASNLYYAKISGSVMSYFINHGYTNMVITYNNNWEEENCPNVGNFVNTKSRIIPKPLAGGEDWSTYDNYISQYATQVGNDFVQTINLVDGVNNFTVDTQIVFINSDVNSNAVTRAYIKSITFTK